jgi:hypothetical protein
LEPEHWLKTSLYSPIVGRNGSLADRASGVRDRPIGRPTRDTLLAALTRQGRLLTASRLFLTCSLQAERHKINSWVSSFARNPYNTAFAYSTSEDIGEAEQGNNARAEPRVV